PGRERPSHEGRDVDAVGDHAALRRAEQTARETFRFLCPRDVDDRVGPGGQAALQGQVCLPYTGWIPLEVDAVERMDRGHAREACGETAVHARALAVGVHQPDAASGNEPSEPGRDVG